MQYHPLADIFPLIEGEEFDSLVEDIRQYGQREPIVVYQNQILDGRNRYRACLEAGIACWFDQYDGDDPAAYVVSLNLKRRHLNESQRAMVAAKLATLHQGARTDLSPIGERSQAEAAELLNVGKRSVERAHEVRDHGAPELQRAVEQGTVSVSAAADVASLPAEAQRDIVARGEKEILAAAKAIRSEKATKRYAARVARLVDVSAATEAGRLASSGQGISPRVAMSKSSCWPRTKNPRPWACFDDGRLAEIFISNAKAGSHSDSAAKDSAVVCSIALQHGVPVDVIRKALLRDTQGRASSPLGCALDIVAERVP